MPGNTRVYRTVHHLAVGLATQFVRRGNTTQPKERETYRYKNRLNSVNITTTDKK